jgi:single-stranded-DNA-specific exonuclease
MIGTANVRSERLENLVGRYWRSRGAGVPAAAAVALARSLSLPVPLGHLLIARGLASEAAAKAFLRPRLAQLREPDSLVDLHLAVTRVTRALRAGETILVHGDYDVDGVCAAALLTRALRELGGHVSAFVPHRLRDGYDFGVAGLQAAMRAHAALIVTVDCGTLAHGTVDAARGAGIDVVITDHHVPGATLPAAVAVVNPRRSVADGEVGVCGTGVAFKLAQAVTVAMGGDAEGPLYHLDLVALATVADLVPLVGENRVLARYGMRVLASSRKAGVRAMLQESGLAGRTLVAGHLSHTLAPRLNAAGRIGEADWALRLLLTEDEGEAAELARKLEALNEERRAVDAATLGEAVATLEASYDPARDYGIVLAAEGWHPGVVGIVASRVVELVRRPAVLIALGAADRGRGSARSVPGFDLLGAIRACGEHLERFGGHRQAAGLEIRPDRVAAFREAFNREARRRLGGEPPVAEIEFDLDLPLAQATPEMFRYLRHFGPFGVGNPTPTFRVCGVRAEGVRTVGRGHVKAELKQGSATLPGIGFGLAGRGAAAMLMEGPVDVLYHLHEDHWNGRISMQARIVDVRQTP